MPCAKGANRGASSAVRYLPFYFVLSCADLFLSFRFALSFSSLPIRWAVLIGDSPLLTGFRFFHREGLNIIVLLVAVCFVFFLEVPSSTVHAHYHHPPCCRLCLALDDTRFSESRSSIYAVGEGIYVFIFLSLLDRHPMILHFHNHFSCRYYCDITHQGQVWHRPSKCACLV